MDNPVLTALRSRSSVRKFTSEPVGKGEVEELLAAAIRAPNGGNKQQWRFHVVWDREMISKICESVRREVGETRERVTSGRAQQQYDAYTSHFFQFESAPVVIVCCCRDYDSVYTRVMNKYAPDKLAGGFTGDANVMSLAAAIENLLLAAHSMGLGGCFMTGPMVARGEIERLLGIELPWYAAALVPIGHPAGDLARAERRPLEEVLVFHGAAPQSGG